MKKGNRTILFYIAIDMDGQQRDEATRWIRIENMHFDRHTAENDKWNFLGIPMRKKR